MNSDAISFLREVCKKVREIDEISDRYLALGSSTKQKNHPIPTFRSFYKEKDPVVEKYEQERNQIRQKYQKQDFVCLTLKKLCSTEWTPLKEWDNNSAAADTAQSAYN